DVLDVRIELGRIVVPEVLGVQVLQVGGRVDEGAAGLRHLLAVDGQEAVHGQLRGGAEAGAHQGRRPEEGVKVGDVLADDVDDVGLVLAAPPGVEVGAVAPAPGEGGGHVADWSVEPDVEVPARMARDLEAEIGRVAGDVPVLEAGGEPLYEL